VIDPVRSDPRLCRDLRNRPRNYQQEKPAESSRDEDERLPFKVGSVLRTARGNFRRANALPSHRPHGGKDRVMPESVPARLRRKLAQVQRLRSGVSSGGAGSGLARGARCFAPTRDGRL
jgi:hypothetical protein